MHITWSVTKDFKISFWALQIILGVRAANDILNFRRHLQFQSTCALFGTADVRKVDCKL